MKKNGGTIKNWQMHTISVHLDVLLKARELNPDFNMERVSVFTGTVVSDPTGRWEEGYHMRSSLILQFDEASGRVETQNTIYILEGEGGGDIIGDIGRDVMRIFY